MLPKRRERAGQLLERRLHRLVSAGKRAECFTGLAERQKRIQRLGNRLQVLAVDQDRRAVHRRFERRAVPPKQVEH